MDGLGLFTGALQVGVAHTPGVFGWNGQWFGLHTFNVVQGSLADADCKAGERQDE